MFLFLVALMHLLITEILSKHLLWIRWITHSFYHGGCRAHTHMQYIQLTVMSCEIGRKGCNALLYPFQHINLGHRLDYHQIHFTLTLTETHYPILLINYTCISD